MKHRQPLREGVDYQVVSDGRTVWVNAPDGNLARFGLGGIDVHREPALQAAEGACLFCTGDFTTQKDWAVFVDKVRELHGVEVEEQHRPVRLR